MTSALEDMAVEAAKELQSEIDKEILWDMLSQLGWTRVMIDRLQDNQHAIDISDWLSENIKNSFERHGRDFIFEKEEDAVSFILKWK